MTLRSLLSVPMYTCSEPALDLDGCECTNPKGWKPRGGIKAVVDLDAHAGALRNAAQAKAEPRGTPVETETINLLDGIIVRLARTARDAAKAAARDLGEPALATAFELSALYKRGPKKNGAGNETGAPAHRRAARVS